MKQRIVITGGPCSGKTSIIEGLKTMGIRCFDEVSRDIIQSMNITTSYKKINFEEAIFERRKHDFFHAKDGINFYDRSMLDNLAYLKFNGHDTPMHLKIDCKNHRYYKKVFISPPWKEIYTKDKERIENFEESVKIYKILKDIYKKNDYYLIEIPHLSVRDRINFIMNKF